VLNMSELNCNRHLTAISVLLRRRSFINMVVAFCRKYGDLVKSGNSETVREMSGRKQKVVGFLVYGKIGIFPAVVNVIILVLFGELPFTSIVHC